MADTKNESRRATFIYSPASPSLLPSHVMVKHALTLARHLQVGLAKMSDEIRNDERRHAQIKVPVAARELLGSARRKVMKHWSRRNVRPN